jgi:LisH
MVYFLLKKVLLFYIDLLFIRLSAPELRSEVRGYLRHRLFTALHNSRMGSSLGQLDAQPVSPKVQTLNLLIAEYLLKMRHHFTLSVFSCEAPNVACVSPNLPEVLKQSSGRSVHVFSKQDLDDVLDTLGLTKDAPPVQALRRKYEQDSQQALLTCILRSLPDMLAQTKAPVQVEVVETRTKENMTKNFDVDEMQRYYNHSYRRWEA